MKRTKLALYIVCAALATQASGCASTPVQKAAPGDRVSITYLCRLGDGFLAAAAGVDIDNDSSLRRAPLYIPRKDLRPVVLTTGAKPEKAVAGLVSMEQEIESRLAASAIGMAAGERKRVPLSAETPKGMPDQERFLKMSLIRKREKELRLSREEYLNKTSKSPELGQRFTIDPLFPGSVSAMDENFVAVRFAPLNTKDIRTPYGPADIRDAGDHYEVELKVGKGSLVRTGPLAGRIIEVDDSSFTIDYGSPFAGETLDCDLTLIKVETSTDALTAEAQQTAGK